jgi:hypothetical protein
VWEKLKERGTMGHQLKFKLGGMGKMGSTEKSKKRKAVY